MMRTFTNPPEAVLVTRSLAAVVSLLSVTPLLLGQTATSPAAGNAASPDQTPPPVTFRTQANLVLLDVVVTGKDGPASGLHRGQFHLFEDGKQQEISVFEEHTKDEVAAGKAPVQLPPHVYGNFPDFNITGAANVLLLDALNTPLSEQLYVRQEMIKYLRNIPPGTRIAVFVLSSQLRMIQGLTANAEVISQIISNNGSLRKEGKGEKEGPAAGASDDSGLEAWQSALRNMHEFEDDHNPAPGDIKIDMTLAALKELAQYLSVIPGRKNLIWFAGSIPLVVDPVATLQSSGLTDRPYFSESRRIADMLTAARISVYPIDATALMPMQINGAPFTGSPGSMPRGLRAPLAESRDQVVRTIGQHSGAMFQIAQDTGGEAFVDSNDLKGAVVRAIDHGSHYYTIGYTPTVNKYDGSFREIKLSVDGDYRAAYRRGYYADAATTTAANLEAETAVVEHASEFGAPPFSQILFQVRVLPSNDPAVKDAKLTPGPAGDKAKDLKGPVIRYVLDFAVDPHSFTFTTTPDGVRHAHIETAVVAYDSRGKRINGVDRGMGYNLTPPLYQQIMHSGLPIHQEIDLPEGSVYLRMVVHDRGSTNVGSTEISLVVVKQ